MKNSQDVLETVKPNSCLEICQIFTRDQLIIGDLKVLDFSD